ncbi:MAG: hypothetical protein V1794_09635 [Candidatus Glassbacteria bacterium]
MPIPEEKPRNNSLTELEQIEGNYYKMDLFVAISLILFTIWVFLAEKNIIWTLVLGVMAILFLIRGFRNWREKTLPARKAKAAAERS